jgi:hypothetical protein
LYHIYLSCKCIPNARDIIVPHNYMPTRMLLGSIYAKEK